MDDATLVEKGMLKQAGELVSALREGNQTQAMQIVDDITRLREKEMFQEIGRMARQLHDALIGLHADSNIVDMTMNQIPDAKEHLGHVVGMTEDAAHHTMTLVENILPVCDEIDMRVTELRGRCADMEKGGNDGAELTRIAQELNEFFEMHQKKSAEVNDGLREILIAQEYQDLTGQVIKRVLELLRQIEDGLVDMIRASGGKASPKAARQKNRELESVTSQDGVDELLSSMGF